jgi:hypothetical protein
MITSIRGGGHSIETGGRPIAEVAVNPLQRALNDYHLMEAELASARKRATDAEVRSASLLAEVNMLRESYERADLQRVHLQGVASSLLGRLLSINDVIGGACRAALKEGIEATSAAQAENELERAGAEVQAILQSLPKQEAPIGTPAQTPTPRPPQAVGAGLGAVIPSVDWSRSPKRVPGSTVPAVSE